MDMKITRHDLQWAASQGVITHRQADDVWALLERHLGNQAELDGAPDRDASHRPRFDAAHVAYYFGALLVIGAMGWFMTTAWEAYGGATLMAISVGYAICFVLAGRTLWDQGLRTPGGLLFTMAVCMTPLATYGFERAVNLWPQNDPGSYSGFHRWVNGGWFMMEIATIVAGLVAIRFRRFAFLMAPIAFTLWYMSMDLTPLVFGANDYSWHNREWVSVMFGLAMLLTAYLVDLRGKVGEDFAFWGYLFGLLAFWGGLSIMNSTSELSKFEYLLINVALIGLSVLLRQRAFIVFGTMGTMGYIGYLAFRVFQFSLMFPFVLTLIGILVIYLGVLYQRNGKAIESFARSQLPESVQQLVPPRARAAYQ
jgi:hypothetical protein